MGAINIKVPDSLLKHAQEMAEAEELTIEQIISSALAEKMAAWMTVEYLQKRAARDSREKFEQAMDKVPDVAPDAQDQFN